MKKELIKLANHLDRIGKSAEADYIDALLRKAAGEKNYTMEEWAYIYFKQIKDQKDYNLYRSSTGITDVLQIAEGTIDKSVPGYESIPKFSKEEAKNIIDYMFNKIEESYLLGEKVEIVEEAIRDGALTIDDPRINDEFEENSFDSIKDME